MKILVFTLSFCLLISCSQRDITSQTQTNVQNNLDNKIEEIKKEKLLEKLPQPFQMIKSPEVKNIGEFALVRNSDNKDKNGWMLPPYKNATIRMGFKDEPQIGEEVTVVPLQVKLAPFQLKILKAAKTKISECPENKDFFWAVELETITNKEILEIEPVKNYYNEIPFSIFAIYPSVEFAKSLNKSTFSSINLPKNISLKRIESAIDFDNDNKPDLLSVRFCCGEPNKESDEKCPYICKKYYKKTNGDWVIHDIQDSQERC